jgi:monovalent cation:H+ antiporter-2, CPA2 family
VWQPVRMDGSARDILEIGAVLLAAAAAGWLARAAGLPAVLGYLAVGLLVSPFTPGYVADRHQLQLFADIGVVLLLFEVGIEVNPLRLGRERGRLLWIAPLHTLLVGGAATAVGVGAGLALRGAMVFGLSVALSSSVVVVNITRSRRRTTNKATDETLLGWSMLQDLTGVAVSAALLASLGFQDRPLWLTLLAIAAFGVVAVAAAWLLPHVLRRIHREPDLFLLVSVASGLALAGVGAQVFGVPLALAAFVAGLAISEAPVTAAARHRLLPFRELFAVLFFVAVGSLIDPSAIPAALPWIGLVLGLVLAVKAGSAYALARAARLAEVRSWQLATGLGQMGEFSFVLASIGVARQLISAQVYTAVLCGVVLTIAASTLAVRWGPWPRLLPEATAG